MIKGLDLFRDHFADFQNNYIMIGGTACTLAMDEFEIDFRATKDLDVVLTIEAIDEKFTTAFWDFLRTGQYSTYQKSSDKHIFYRFKDPQDDSYPDMIELFARNTGFNLEDNAEVTPIKWKRIDDTDAKSLSAILLDDDYYHFIHGGKVIIDGIPTIRALHLIPIKGYAWIDNMKRKQAGEDVDERNIRKHRSDIIRLSQLLTPEMSVELPGRLHSDTAEFLSALENSGVDPRQLGIKRSLNDIVNDLRDIYSIRSSSS